MTASCGLVWAMAWQPSSNSVRAGGHARFQQEVATQRPARRSGALRGVKSEARMP